MQRLLNKNFVDMVAINPTLSSVRLLLNYFKILNFAGFKSPVPNEWKDAWTLINKKYGSVLSLTNEIKNKLANKDEIFRTFGVDKNNLLATLRIHLPLLKSMKVRCFGKGKISTAFTPSLFQKEMRPIVTFLIDVFTNIKRTNAETKHIDLCTSIISAEKTLDNDFNINQEDIGINPTNQGILIVLW
jgi:hypothetical protein